MGKWSESQIYQDTRGTSRFTRFVGWLNNLMNPEHAWVSDWNQFSHDTSPSEDVINQVTKSALTGAEREANAFNAAEAQKQRDFEMEMSNTSYQRSVADMQAAGVNPALAMSNGGASTPSGSSASSVSPTAGMTLSDLMQVVMLPLQKKLMQSQSKMYSDQGEAALTNAAAAMRNAVANERNAGSNERNAGVNEFNAETNRMRQEVDAWVAKYDINVKEATADHLAADAARIRELTRQLPEQLKIAQQNADAHTRQAYAALQSALASVRQAAVAEKLSDSEIALREAQAAVHWADKEGRAIVNKYLDQEEMAKIGELSSRSGFLDASARNLDRNEKVQLMQTITGYANTGCKIFGSVLQGVSGFPQASNPIGFGN